MTFQTREVSPAAIAGVRFSQRFVLGPATALKRAVPLATHNVQDFAWIEGLEVIDPVQP